MDERHFNFYDHAKRLPNQVTLLEKLTELGFEKAGKSVLTAQTFGVPVTAILLLMKDAQDEILKIQQELESDVDDLPTISTDDLTKTYDVSVTSAADINALMWERKRSNDIYPDFVISGSGTVGPCDYIIPQQPLTAPLSDFFGSQDPNVLILNDAIKVKSEPTQHSDNKALIPLYKNLFLFLEFSYALSERIRKAEKIEFESLLSTTIALPNEKQVFKGNCSRRGALIHSSFINISISFENSIKIGSEEKKVTTIVNDGLNEACEWVDKTYQNMLTALG